jgi:hypothetical protein
MCEVLIIDSLLTVDFSMSRSESGRIEEDYLLIPHTYPSTSFLPSCSTYHQNLVVLVIEIQRHSWAQTHRISCGDQEGFPTRVSLITVLPFDPNS